VFSEKVDRSAIEPALDIPPTICDIQESFHLLKTEAKRIQQERFVQYNRGKLDYLFSFLALPNIREIGEKISKLREVINEYLQLLDRCRDEKLNEQKIADTRNQNRHRYAFLGTRLKL
jgi:hypothetical protein